MRPVERFIRGPRNSDASPSSNIGLPGQPGRGAYLISSEHLPSLWHVGCVLVYGSLCLATFYHASVESDVLQIAVAVLLANAAGLSALVVNNHLKACTWMLRLDEWQRYFAPTQRQALASAAVEDISASTVQAGPSRRRGLVPILMAIAICAAFLTLF